MDLRHHCTRAITVGSLAWLAWVVLGTGDLIVDLFVLSPLVLAPLVLRLLLARDAVHDLALRISVVAQLPAAALATVSFALAPGPVAAALVLPWCGVTLALAWHALGRVRARRGLAPIHALAIDSGLVYVVVGAAWWTVDRLGMQPLEFSASIVRLTAVHFHFAGFALPVLAGLGAARVPGPLSRAAALGVIAGVPVVAVGITWSPALELAGAFVTAAAAFSVGLGQLRWALVRARASTPTLARRAAALLAVSGVCAMTAMVVALTYGIGEYLERPWPSIAQMVSLHGAINALGFCLLGLWGWNLAEEHADDEPTLVADD